MNTNTQVCFVSPLKKWNKKMIHVVVQNKSWEYILYSVGYSHTNNQKFGTSVCPTLYSVHKYLLTESSWTPFLSHLIITRNENTCMKIYSSSICNFKLFRLLNLVYRVSYTLQALYSNIYLCKCVWYRYTYTYITIGCLIFMFPPKIKQYRYLFTYDRSTN